VSAQQVPIITVGRPVPSSSRIDLGMRNNYRMGLLKITRFAQWSTLQLFYSEIVAYTWFPELEIT
jgi:hypothetical protein